MEKDPLDEEKSKENRKRLVNTLKRATNYYYTAISMLMLATASASALIGAETMAFHAVFIVLMALTVLVSHYNIVGMVVVGLAEWKSSEEKTKNFYVE